MNRKLKSISQESPAVKSRVWGFTLTELLVSIGILVLFVGASIPAFRTIGRDRQLELIVEEVKDAVVLARTNILAPPRGETVASLKSFNFKIPNDSKKYQVLKIAQDNTPTTVLEKVLPRDLVFEPSSLEIVFEFDKQGKPNASADFLIRSQSRDKSRTISVSSTGTTEVR